MGERRTEGQNDNQCYCYCGIHVQWLEGEHGIEAAQELWAQPALALACGLTRATVAGHDKDSVLAAHSDAACRCQAPIVEHWCVALWW